MLEVPCLISSLCKQFNARTCNLPCENRVTHIRVRVRVDKYNCGY